MERRRSGGIIIRASAHGDTTFDYVEIHNAGTTGHAALRLERAVSVTNTTITDSAGYAILHQAADSTDYTTGNSVSNNTQGDVSTL